MSACVITERLLLACREAASAVTPGNLFSWSERLSSRLNYDPRSAWDAGSAGFSPNDHRELQEAVTYPYSEFLSSVALQTYPFDADKAWEATYTAWLEPLPLMVARLAAADRLPGRPSRRFSFAIQKRSQALNYFTFSRED
jgi:CRISPR-associated protein Csb3